MKEKTKSTTSRTYYIGLDVHKNSVSVGYACSDGSAPEYYGKFGGSNQAVERGLLRLRRKLGAGKEDLRLCYEAGPTGFMLVRRLKQLGYDAIVVAPSKIPRKSGDKVKTDRKDCTKFAGLHRAGELEAIHIPDDRDEAVRDVCRARTDASEALRKTKQQFQAFLLRNGINYTGKSTWTLAHMSYLRDLTLVNPANKIVLEEYLMAIDSGVERVERLEHHMEELLEGWERAPFVRALMALRGFQVVAAMTVISELGDLSRFESPRQLMAYLGLVPGEESSGERRRQGSITKCGNGHARWMLVECAQHYRLKPKVSGALGRRQKCQSAKVKALSWRTQERLYRRFARLCARGLLRNKALIAVARELSAFLWELDALVRAQQAASKTKNGYTAKTVS